MKPSPWLITRRLAKSKNWAILKWKTDVQEPRGENEMIEFPEAFTIAHQITVELKGKRIESAIRGNVTHKFAFYSRTPEEYATILQGKAIGEAHVNGPLIVTTVEPGYVIVLGGGGERILLHHSENTIPKKHHLLLHFEDHTHLSVTVQGWGSALLLTLPELQKHPFYNTTSIPPLSKEFTYQHFKGLVEGLEPEDSRSIKYFMISKPGILGVGNGYLQDILFRAKIHPRRRAAQLTEAEKQALFHAIPEVLQKAVDLSGRDTEHDLYDQPGKYVRILDNRYVGKPCPECNTPIEKASFLGGAVYFCPNCQALP
jgi:formamidopyrimidine-DNA glycosylase